MLFDKLSNALSFKQFILFFYQQVFSIASLFVPVVQLPYYLGILFQIAYLLFLLVVDDIAIIPFQTTHKAYLLSFSIPLYLQFFRFQYAANVFYLGSLTIWLLLLYFVFLVVFGLQTSKNRTISYFGSIERGMGIDFYIQMFSLLPIVSFLIYRFSFIYVVSLLILSQIIEVQIIEMQHEQHTKKHNFNIKYMLEMGNRYVGTLSNPIHTSQYLTMILPLTLFIVLSHTSFFWFQISLFFASVLTISYGIWRTAGRQSSISYFIELVLMSIVLLFEVTIYLSLSSIFVFQALYFVYFKYFGESNFSRLKNVFAHDTFDLNKLDSAPSGNEKWVNHLSKNDRKVLWFEALIISLKHYLLRGSGLSNLPNAYCHYGSKNLHRYYPDKTIDSSHSMYFDLMLSLGFIPSLVQIQSLFSIFVVLLIDHQFIFQISMLIFLFEFLFSFPLQSNMFALLMIIQSSSQILQFNFSLPIIILLSIAFGFNLINLYFQSKENRMLQLIQLGLSAGSVDNPYQLDLFNAQIYEAPWDTRPFIYIRPVLVGNMVKQGRITLNDLMMFSELLETNFKKLLLESENKSQVFYLFQYVNLTIQMSIQNMKNNDYKTVNRYIQLANKYLNLSLIANPYSIDTRLLYTYFLMFVNSDGRFNNVLAKMEDKIQYDICMSYGISGEFFGFVEAYLTKYDQVKTEHYDEIKKIFEDRMNKR